MRSVRISRIRRDYCVFGTSARFNSTYAQVYNRRRKENERLWVFAWVVALEEKWGEVSEEMKKMDEVLETKGSDSIYGSRAPGTKFDLALQRTSVRV